MLYLYMNVSRSKLFSLSSIQCKLKVLGHFAGHCVTLCVSFCVSVERTERIPRIFLRVRARSSHARSQQHRTGTDPACRSACHFSQISARRSRTTTTTNSLADHSATLTMELWAPTGPQCALMTQCVLRDSVGPDCSV